MIKKRYRNLRTNRVVIVVAILGDTVHFKYLISGQQSQKLLADFNAKFTEIKGLEQATAVTHYRNKNTHKIVFIRSRLADKLQVQYVPSGNTSWYFNHDFARLFEKID